MKKLLSIMMALVSSAILYAQSDITKFLGIPVDGSKTAMKQKLEAKGYRYNSTLDCLEGEFNGQEVHIYIVTNNNKVWRIMVTDAFTSNETDIKIRFNTLCRQFSNNKKYISASSSDYSLSDDEDISYNMMVKNKRYEAAYFQLPEVEDPTTDILELSRKKIVWFMINEQYGIYRIFMYYDNEYNHSNGEDL